MELITVKIEKPDNLNVIVGQAHFIKTVEDIHEALVTTVPGIQFGLAFCEASGLCLIRWSGTNSVLVELAQRNAEAISAGHSFLIFLGEGFYPINILNALRSVSEVCGIYCATANPVEVILAVTDLGRGIVGVIDGAPPKGVEVEQDIALRKGLLRQFGYKL
jgi:adenosine/AMP kinase